MKKLVGPGLLLLASIIWGFAFPAQKIVESVPPMAVIALRSVIATLFLFPMVFLFDHIQKNERHFVSRRGLDFTRYELIGGGVIGVIYGIASGVQQMGLSEGTDGGKGAFISALYVVIVPLIGLVLGRRVRPLVWGGIVMAVVGFYLLCIKGDFTMTKGDLLILLCAFIFAFHILAVDHFSPKCDGVRMSLVQFFVSAIVMTILSLIFEGPLDFSLVLPCLLPLLYLGIGSSGVAYTLQIVGQRITSPAVATLILSLESVFGVIGSMLVLGEKMTVREVIGSVIVFSAVVLAQLPEREKKKAEKEE